MAPHTMKETWGADSFEPGAYARKVSTTSPGAQIRFERGLNGADVYTHEEVSNCFRPGC